MKKLGFLLLMLSFGAFFVGCGGESSDTPAAETPAAEGDAAEGDAAEGDAAEGDETPAE